MGTIKINNKEIKYRIRTSLRSKSMCIKLDRDLQVEVVIPQGQKIEDVEPFLEKESHWIESKYQELSKSNKIFDGNRLLHRGRYYPISNIPHDESGKIELSDDKITVHGSPESNYYYLTKWMKDLTTNYVRTKVEKLSSRFGLDYKNIYVSSISKWGLCSRKGDLTFNWQLIALPEELSEYVVMHELAHLLEFNHSERFKGQLAKMCPCYKERQRQLKTFFTI